MMDRGRERRDHRRRKRERMLASKTAAIPAGMALCDKQLRIGRYS
jgi:hypothetical protein